MKFEKYKISQIGVVVGGGTPSTKVEEYYGGDIPWITPKDLSGYSSKFIDHGERNITDEGLKNSSARLLPINTVLLSSRAPIGYLAIAANPLSTNQGFKSIICNEDLVLPDYLYYLLKTKKEELEAISSGSTFKEVSGKAVKSFEVELPTIYCQHKICSILDSLDSKIELNNQMIATLEELAATLFKRWFVDFEFPDENGNPYKSSGGKMVDSELGEIPEGWEVKKVGEIAKIVRGASPRPIQEFMAPDGRPWVKISDANAAFSPFLYSTKEYINFDGISKSRTVESGTLILSNSATPGIPKIMKIRASVHDGWLIFTDYNAALYKEYLYLFLKNERESILQLSNGSVFRNLKTDILKKYPIVVPSETMLHDFNLIIEPLFSEIDIQGMEINDLSKIRNTLLPKLLTGDIKV